MDGRAVDRRKRKKKCDHRGCSHQKLEETKKGLYPRTPGSVALLTP